MRFRQTFFAGPFERFLKRHDTDLFPIRPDQPNTGGGDLVVYPLLLFWRYWYVPRLVNDNAVLTRSIQDAGDELLRRHCPQIPTISRSHGDGAILYLAIANDEEVGYSL